MDFTRISRSELQAAFGIAHKCSEDPAIPLPHRRKFAAIARLIWKGHGEPGIPPAGSGASLLDHDLLAALASGPNWPSYSTAHPKTTEPSGQDQTTKKETT